MGAFALVAVGAPFHCLNVNMRCLRQQTVLPIMMPKGKEAVYNAE